MRRTDPWLLVAFLATGAFAAPRRQAVARPPAADAGPPRSEGAIGDGAPQSFAPLTAAEVQSIVTAAATATNADAATIAVVDRAGRVLALYRAAKATGADDDRAVGLARTAAFFSHNQAPLSSRTVRFLSGVHFPPGVENAPNAALYGIENTNRGCSLNTPFNAGKDVPPATSIAHPGKCEAGDTTGCGPGIVTGKQQPDDGPYPQSVGNRSVDAGGIPLYRLVAPGLDRIHEGVVTNGELVGGIGVAGIPGDPRIAEYAAATGAFGAAGIGPVPFYPLPDPGNVFIDGIRLPFLDPHARLRFNDDGLPIGLEAPDGVQAAGSIAAGTFVIAPVAGGCADNEYLAGPHGGALTAAQVDGIVQRAIAAAKRTRGTIRLPLNSYARMVIAVTDLDGTVLALYRMPDATVFSIDVAVAKARNVVWFSSDARDLPGVPAGTAVSNRTIGFGAQPLFPPGIEHKPGPFFTLFTNDLAHVCTQGSDASHPQNQNGIVFFPGATPLYANGKLVGGLGVSGDGVEQDDYVTYLAAGNLLPDRNHWADRIEVDGVRLPMFKFPRQPEGVTECGGKPCS
ncbi:MAG TPA: heme-binding protein [Thermoanaerobaculia bacterium]|nr:heme-binding protein [Thermoanaerobaculia bacterium]